MSALRLRRLARGLEAATWLVVARVAIRLVPFRHVARAMRPRVRRASPQGADRRRIVGAVARAVRIVADRSPIPMVCFPRAIAAQRMLARRGVAASLPFGMRRDETGALVAHVWVVVDGHTVLGGPVTDYAVLAVFDADPGPS